MRIDLFEHNQIAYQEAYAMLKSVGKAAVVHPTGTGKSFIAFGIYFSDTGGESCGKRGV